MKLLPILLLIATHTLLYAQEDTASVTYMPSEDIYLLQYNLLGITYIDTLIPSTRIDPIVSCSVTAQEGLYTFAYAVLLLSTSQQHLSSFMVSHPAPILSPTKPNARWIQGEFAHNKIWEWSNALMDPAGLWTPTKDIAPGSSLSGFTFKTDGLPAIVNSYFKGNAPWHGFRGEPPQKIYDLLEPIRGFPNNTVIRRTLGPAYPPTPFNALTFLDTITSYISESRTLGWITNDPTANKYKRLIDTARFHLQANNRSVTKAKLDSVLVNVYPDSAAGLITSEAYALLRFNTEYLLKKLSEEEERLDGKNK